MEGIIHNLRDQILRKPRILEEVLSILIEFLKEDSSKLSLETQLIMIELFCNWNYSDISFLGEWMQFSLVAFGLSPLIHLISLNSIPDNVKIELHLIIQNFQGKLVFKHFLKNS